MRKSTRTLAMLLALAFMMSFCAGADPANAFVIPDGVTTLETGAFEGIPLPNGVRIPATVTSIADDAFTLPEGTLNVYGYRNTEAERYAGRMGDRAAFTPLDLKDFQLHAPAWLSPHREATLSVSAKTFDGEDAVLTRFHYIIANAAGETVFDSGETAQAEFSFKPLAGGSYSVRGSVGTDISISDFTFENAFTVAEPIRFASDALRVGVGRALAPLAADETRAVTLTSDSEGLRVSGNTVTGVAPGTYTLTAAAETPEGTVYTDATVEVVIAADSLIVEGLPERLFEGETAKLTVALSPDNVTHPEITWKSSSDAVATVDDTGFVTAVSQGTCVISATCYDAICELPLSVTKPVQTLTIRPLTDAQSLYPGDTIFLTADAAPAEADDPTVAWTSNNEDVARVDARTGKVSLLQAGDAVLTAAANDGSGVSAAYEIHVLPGATALTLSGVPALMSIGDSAALAAAIEPEGLTGQTVTWSVSQPSVAFVDQNGTLGALSPGECTVTAVCGNASASARFVVATPVETVKSALNDVYLDKTTKTADATKFVFVYPKNATNTALTWKSSDSTIAKVSDKGVITALKKGTTVITATAHNGISAIFTVHAVTDGTVIRAQSVSPTYAALAVGGKTVLTASQTGGTGAYRTGTFYCDNSSVLSLSISGNQCTVTALKPGEANVYAISSSGRVAVCEVLVKPRFVQSLTLSPNALSLNRGETAKLDIAFTPANATERTFRFSSSNPAVATVSEDGTVTAVSAGTAEITAYTEDGVTSNRCTVTVPTVMMTAAALVSQAHAGIAGETFQIEYTFEPETATPAAFRWTSDAPEIASVDEKTGLVTLLAAGTTTVRGTAADGSELTLACEITVSEIPVRAFVLDADELSLNWNETHALSWAVFPAGASFGSPVFASANEGIARVDAQGVITAVSKGETEITATVGRGEYQLTQTVRVTVVSDGTTTYRALIAGRFGNAEADGAKYLPFSVRSTQDVRGALSRSAIEGQAYDSIQMLPNNASNSAWKSALTQLAAQADADDVTVIFLLSHGSIDASKGYYLHGAGGESRIYGSELMPVIRKIPGHVVLIVCSCHSGGILKFYGGASVGKVSVLCSTVGAIKSSYYDTPEPGKSYDFFTRALVRGLGWGAAGTLPADANGDGLVTLSEIASYTRTATQRDIAAFIQRNGTAQFNGDQSQFPTWRFASGEGDLVIFGRR